MKESWREHPLLKDRFHPDYPDDIMAIVHEGFRTTDKSPEQVWVRVTGMKHGLVSATLLNQPHRLNRLKQGESYLFLVEKSVGQLILTSRDYLVEIKHWEIEPCDKCGNSLLWETPGEISQVAFQGLPPGTVMHHFTTFCPLCGGIVGVTNLRKDN